MEKLNRIKYRIWKEDDIIMGEVQFNDWDNPNLKKFQNLYAENIKETRNLELLKDEGYPTKFDSEYILLEKNVFEEAKKLIETLQKEFPKIPMHPGFLAFLFKTKKYREYSQFIAKRNKMEWETSETVDKLFSFSIATSHDYPYVMCYSKIHTEEQLKSEIEVIIKKSLETR